MAAVLNEAVMESLELMLRVAVIIFPLMVMMTFIEEYGLITKLGSVLRPVAHFFRLSNRGGLVMVLGLVFGLTYGGGALIDSAHERKLDRSELITLGLFLSICHAVFEDTLLFVAFGGNFGWMLGTRLLLAVILIRGIAACRGMRSKQEIKIGK